MHPNASVAAVKDLAVSHNLHFVVVVSNSPSAIAYRQCSHFASLTGSVPDAPPFMHF